MGENLTLMKANTDQTKIKIDIIDRYLKEFEKSIDPIVFRSSPREDESEPEKELSRALKT